MLALLSRLLNRAEFSSLSYRQLLPLMMLMMMIVFIRARRNTGDSGVNNSMMTAAIDGDGAGGKADD